MHFSKFMAGSVGRLLRIITGATLIYLGFFVMKNTAGSIVGIIGVAPLFDMPFMGQAIRAYTTKQ